LEKGTPIGGVVQDDSGKPAADAKVSFIVPSGFNPGASYGTWQEAKTDADGRWMIDDAPPDLTGMNLELEHPGYAKTTLTADLPPPERLRDRSAVVVISNPIKLAGVVSDSAGNPIAGATLGRSDFNGNQTTVATSAADGSYSGKCDPGYLTLIVSAPGFASAPR